MNDDEIEGFGRALVGYILLLATAVLSFSALLGAL
jgi:hypothetical protein